VAVLLANNVSSTIATSISDIDTTITVATGTGASFPVVTSGDYFYATITSTAGVVEIVKVTSRTGDALGVTRGQDGTAAAAFALGSLVEMRINVASVADYVAQFSFEDRYLGSQSADPTTRIDGSALQAGDFYYNSVSSQIKVYDGSAWQSLSAATTVEEFTATASQTLFNLVNPYTIGSNNLSVFINGVRQGSTAYTETSTTSVTFVSGLTVADLVQFVVS
jgi:hypothetical protein